jgi:protein tyrosine/serine phosphatase
MAAPRRRQGHALLVAIIAVVLGALAWQKLVRPHVIPKNFGEVVPGPIYRSGELTAGTLQKLVNEKGIRTVVDLGTFPADSAAERREQRAAEALHITRYRFDLYGDATGNPNYYVQALRLMNDPQNQPILVHCGAGAERTGCAVILYRHIIEGKPIDEAYDEARRHRHDPDRNPRLREVLDQWGPKIKDAFLSGGQIPGTEPAPEPRPTRSP